MRPDYHLEEAAIAYRADVARALELALALAETFRRMQALADAHQMTIVGRYHDMLPPRPAKARRRDTDFEAWVDRAQRFLGQSA